jgi:hypothetical protein
MMIRYAVREVYNRWHVVKVENAQAQAMEERGEGMLYRDPRTAHGIAGKLNRRAYDREHEVKRQIKLLVEEL